MIAPTNRHKTPANSPEVPRIVETAPLLVVVGADEAELWLPVGGMLPLWRWLLVVLEFEFEGGAEPTVIVTGIEVQLPAVVELDPTVMGRKDSLLSVGDN
jgi:hypothetical protein